MRPTVSMPITKSIALQSQRAMTLVELLITLAIVSILASLSFPAFRSAQMSARKTVCLSNLHQSSLALALYTQDYNGAFPSYRIDSYSYKHPEDYLYWHDHFCQSGFNNPESVTWASLVRAYLHPAQADKESTLFCPLDLNREQRPLTSYEMKMWLSQDRFDSEIQSPGKVVAIWEQWTYHDSMSLSKHDRRAALNMVFVDGHAMRLPLSQTTTAQFGAGPDLHWSFPGSNSAGNHAGQDITD